MATSIKINMGRTINLGNYESMRADVSLEERIDEDLSEEQLVAAYKEVREKSIRMLDATLKKMHENYRS